MKTTKQQQSIALKTMAIKAKLSNWIRTELYNSTTLEKSKWWKNRNKKVHTDSEKIEFFDQLYKLYNEMDQELTNYKHKRRSKDLVQKEREARKVVTK